MLAVKAPDDTHPVNSGSCRACHKTDVKVISSSCKLYVHGPRGRRCPGSNSTPYNVRRCARIAHSTSTVANISYDSSQTFIKRSSLTTTEIVSHTSENDLSINNTNDNLSQSYNANHRLCNKNQNNLVNASTLSHSQAPSDFHSSTGVPNSIGPTELLNATTRSQLKHPISVPPLKHIPRAARVHCATLLNKILQEILKDSDSFINWQRLLDFGNILAKPKRGGANKNLSNLLLKRVRTFDTVSYQPSSLNTEKAPSRKKSDDSKLASLITSKIEDGNLRGAIRIITSLDSPASNTNETFEALKSKHPEAPDSRQSSVNPFEDDKFKPLVLSTADIMKAISSFPSGSAGGPDGLIPQHLKDLVSRQTGDTQLLSSLTSFANLLLSKRLPVEISKIFFGGKLIAIQKKDGGIRPIVIGYTLRRMTAKAANLHAMTRANSILAPLQVGVGSPLGAEAAAHATRRYIQELPEDHILVKLDFKNAFNSVSRDKLLEVMKEHYPELYRFVHSCYSESTELQFFDRIILSSEGTQQGDPLGPLEFSLSVHHLLTGIKSEFKLGYLDDFTIGGNIDSVAKDIDFIKMEGRKIGLELNESKSELISHPRLTSIPDSFTNFTRVSIDKATLLGAPVGSNDAINEALDKKIKDFDLAISRLKLVSAHDALIILRNALSLPKLMYILRTSPCFDNDKLNLFDDFCRQGISSIVNVSLNDIQWSQVSLPVNAGGLGIRKASDIALPAYLASAVGSSSLMLQILPSHLRSTNDPTRDLALAAWSLASDFSPAPPETVAFKQKSWDRIIVTKTQDHLLANATDDYDKARLRATFSKNSGDWLNAIPLSSVGLRLDNESIRVAIGFRLGATICEPHICPCGANVDARGTHGLSCQKRTSGRHLRHRLLNDIIWRSLGRAQFPALKEPNGLFRTDGKRPDGVTILPWARGKCVAWDATTPDTLAKSHIDKTKNSSGAAAEFAAEKKSTKYSDINQSHIFVPIAVETMGSWSSSSLNFINELGKRLTNVTGDKRETSFLKQRISMAIQRGNVASFFACLPDYKDDLDNLSLTR